MGVLAPGRCLIPGSRFPTGSLGSSSPTRAPVCFWGQDRPFSKAGFPSFHAKDAQPRFPGPLAREIAGCIPLGRALPQGRACLSPSAGRQQPAQAADSGPQSGPTEPTLAGLQRNRAGQSPRGCRSPEPAGGQPVRAERTARRTDRAGSAATSGVARRLPAGGEGHTASSGPGCEGRGPEPGRTLGGRP